MINTGKERVKNKRLRSQLGLDDPPKRQKRERIMLISSASMKRYPVYSDIEVGIAGKYQGKIIQARLDEDNDTDEGTVMAGLERSIDILTKSLKTRKNNKKKCSLSKPKGRNQTRRQKSAKSHL